MTPRRWLLICGVATATLVAGDHLGALQAPAAAQSPEQTLLTQYCTGCHNDRAKAGGLTLTSADPSNVGASPRLWEAAVRKLRARAMPPAGARRPDERGYEQLISYLETRLDTWAAAHPDPGRTDTLRRLTRTEYQNAIRDLLALDVDVTDLLPKDDASFGFDNVSAVSFSPTLIEKYLTAAQKVTRLALGTPVPAPVSRVFSLPGDLTQEEHVDGLPFGTRGGTAVRYTFPRDGVYEFQVRLVRNRNENVEGLTEPAEMELTLDGERLQLFTITPNRVKMDIYYADEGVDKHLQLRRSVAAGPHEVAATFLRKDGALIETERQPYVAHFNNDRHPRIQPAVQSVSITGPFDSTGVGSTPSRDRIFGCRPSSPAREQACAKTIVTNLAHRAFRRPVTDKDIAVPMDLYEKARATGDFETGIEVALRAILTSAEFLFRVEQDPPKT